MTSRAHNKLLRRREDFPTLGQAMEWHHLLDTLVGVELDEAQRIYELWLGGDIPLDLALAATRVLRDIRG